ncbi:MAG: hypothetical protein NTY34_02365 [Candidatus Omnitrophica bacterium]|nr:hypothetical protein [Candidatus Omnitrophota bacterium]
MIKLTIILLILLLTSPTGHADEQSKVVSFLGVTTAYEAQDDLTLWTDSELIEELSRIPLNKNGVKKLYAEFKNTIVNPPNPDTYTEYGIANGEESLVKVERLGRKIHNMLFAISDEDVEKYGNLLQIMRDVLYLDSKHIPLAIKHDNSRDVYWYGLHAKWISKAEAYYNMAVGEKQSNENIFY